MSDLKKQLGIIPPPQPVEGQSNVASAEGHVVQDQPENLPVDVATPVAEGSSCLRSLTTALGQQVAAFEAIARPPPPIPPTVDVHDLDWPTVRKAVDPRAVCGRIQTIVESMESLLDRADGPGMLFDSDRPNGWELALRVSRPPPALWFIGDLHGDLLALEASLDLIRKDASSAERPKIVLLGDLFDDGGFSLEVLLRVFELIVENPSSTMVIAGNHDEALSFDGVRFRSSVDPSDFADFLNDNLADEWIERAGRLAVRFFAQAPRALFFPDGLLASHGGFPLADLHQKLAESGDWDDPMVLADFIWARAHPKARKKLPNRYTRGSQFGYEDFAAFCELAARLGWPVTHMVRGHDHVDDRFAIYPAYSATPMLTTVALSRRLGRESYGPYERAPSLARYIEGSLPQVYRLHIPPDLIRDVYPPLEGANKGTTPAQESEG